MKRSILIAALIAAPIAASAAPEAAQPPKKPWLVEGVMSDACQCDFLCPCEFDSLPTHKHCDDAAILHIDKGFLGDIKLDGKRVAVVSTSPQGARLVDSVGKLRWARIYVPEETSDQEAEALAEVARRVFGSFVTKAFRLSPDEKVQKVKMHVEIEPLRHKVVIPNVLELELKAVTGGDGKNPIKVQNNSFTAAGFGEITAAKTTVYKYTDGKIRWDYGGLSASIRPFKLKGE
jgi:hypothetical protein